METKITCAPLECPSNGPLWLNTFTLLLVVFLTIYNTTPKLPLAFQRILQPLRPNIDIHEAEALLQGQTAFVPGPTQNTTNKPLRGRSIIYASLGLCQMLVWGSLFWLSSFRTPSGDERGLLAAPFISTLAWAYATMRPAMHPRNTPSYDLLSIYFLLLLREIEVIAVAAYHSYVYQTDLFPHGIKLFASLLDITFLMALIAFVFNTPIATPEGTSGISREAIGKTISPEDYTTLWKWMTFGWVTELTKRESLYNEEDVWDLSPTMATRAIYTKYAEIGESYRDPNGNVTPGSFFWQWWACNSSDILIQFGFCMLSVVLDFSSPLFLKLILECITSLGKETSSLETRRLRAQAMIYALSTFACSVVKAGSDLNHLYYGRRAATRTRNEAMIAIYDKALRRRDVITPPTNANKEGLTKASNGSNAPAAGEANAAKSDGKQGADIGKLVNLMSTDTRTLDGWINMAYWFYNAPLQLVISIFFLYQLLGWSAFAGVLIFLFVGPTNHILSGRAIKIYQRLQEARDKKMSVLNEMISEIKFIKLMAHEDGWMKRTFDARAKELKLVRKSGYVDIMYSIIWNACPIGVSILSFWTYTWNGHQLSVATAFTAVQLFVMLGGPLRNLPAVYVNYLKVKVSVERIAHFLSEGEVDSKASSLNRADRSLGCQGTDEATANDRRVGILNGSFLWYPPNTTTDRNSERRSEKQAWWRTKFWSKQPIGDSVSSLAPNDATTPLISNINTDVEPALGQPAILNGVTSSLSTSITTERQFELRNINVQFPPGELSLITGPTASGKTALLRALLGEMYTMETTANSPKTQIFLPKYPTVLDKATGLRSYVSYVAQTPWLEHLTIKENIIFGSEFDEARYKQVLECCALNPDLEALEDGDETEIGERGVSLSGGQKARVALARSVYAPTSVLLLDDPLSAVDSHTAQFLIDRLFQGPLMAKRTVIMVTHHMELALPVAEYVLTMLDGHIDTQGSVFDLRNRQKLQEIISQEKKETKSPKDKDRDGSPVKLTRNARKLVEEERVQGKVKRDIYMTYMRASAYATWVGLIVFTVSGSMMEIGQKVWMQIWGDAYEAEPKSTLSQDSHTQTSEYALLPFTALLSRQPVEMRRLPSADEHPLFYVGGLALVGLLSIILQTIASGILVLGTYRASKILFGQLLHGVMRATMRWQDTTTTGRILNRLSKDFETIDTKIGSNFSSTIRCLCSLLLSIVIIVVISPVFIFPGTLIALAYLSISKIYLETTRPLKRLESTTLSPVFASYRTTLEGLATIRAFSAERRFLDAMISKLDITTKCYWSYWMMNRWVLVRFDILSSLTVLVVMVIVVAFGGSPASQFMHTFGGKTLSLQGIAGVSSGLEGLIIVSSMGFTNSVYWVCRSLTQLELDLNAVERITEYLMLPQESPYIIESNRPPAYWPSVLSSSSQEEFISVENLIIKYAPDLPPVLRGISFKIRGKERVGLVGRTGSGKSTLATALLRFVDPQSGRIVIDGIDIASIGLFDLRSRVTFIPQDSVLFSGTIRGNLDPFEEHTDEACLDVLRRVNLIDSSSNSTGTASTAYTDPAPSFRPFPPSSLRSSPTFNSGAKQVVVTLDSIVTPGGSNFSHGQRQLITLARALLRKTSVVIMDEATSSIDFETDKIIQATLREEFGSSCIITIAHRLHTIMDYDRVIVMDSGRIVENGSPSELLTNTKGMFYSMCIKAGTIRSEK